VLSICAFKNKRWTLGGALLSFSAFTRIFPAIFFLAFAVTAVRDTIAKKRVKPAHLKVFGGAFAVALFLTGAGLAMYGATTFKESAQNLLMHNKSYSSQRVGLGDLLVFRGETSNEEIMKNGGIAAKELKVQGIQPKLKFIGFIAILFIGFYMWKTKKPLHEIIFLAIIPFYCLTNPQINYYYVRLPLVLWLASHLDSRIHKLGLIGIFAVDIITQYVFLQNVPRYTVTSTTSTALAVYFILLILIMTYELIKPALKSIKE
jgi:hypothetical protein